MVSGQRDRRGWAIEWECECEYNDWEESRSRKTNIWQQQMIVCRHAREQGSGALKGSCVSSGSCRSGVSGQSLNNNDDGGGRGVGHCGAEREGECIILL